MKAHLRGFAAVVATMVFLPAVAFAQSATSQAPPETYKLSLEEAVRLALENNVDIQVEKMNPELSAVNVTQAEGAYDPALSGQLSRSSSTSQPQNTFTGSTTDTWALQPGSQPGGEDGRHLQLELDQQPSDYE